MANVSLRQLQWWDEQRVVCPYHEGHRRLYDPADVMRVLLVAALRQKGLALHRTRGLIKATLLKQLEGDSVGERFLVGDSKHMRLIESRGELIDLMKQSRRPLFVLSVPDVFKPLNDEMGVPRPAIGYALRGKKK